MSEDNKNTDDFSELDELFNSSRSDPPSSDEDSFNNTEKEEDAHDFSNVSADDIENLLSSLDSPIKDKDTLEIEEDAVQPLEEETASLKSDKDTLNENTEAETLDPESAPLEIEEDAVQPLEEENGEAEPFEIAQSDAEETALPLSEELEIETKEDEIENGPEGSKTSPAVYEEEDDDMPFSDLNSESLSEQDGSDENYGNLPQAHTEREKALLNFKEGNWTEAKKILQELIETDSSNPAHYYNLGVCCMETKDTEGALASFKRALELNHKDYKTLCNLAGIYFYKKQYAEAAKLLERAVAVNPNDINSRYNLNFIRKKLNRSFRKK